MDDFFDGLKRLSWSKARAVSEEKAIAIIEKRIRGELGPTEIHRVFGDWETGTLDTKIGGAWIFIRPEFDERELTDRTGAEEIGYRPSDEVYAVALEIAERELADGLAKRLWEEALEDMESRSRPRRTASKPRRPSRTSRRHRLAA